MDLYPKHIHLANWGRVLAQEIFMHLQDRHISRFNLTAHERYLKFLKDFPGIIGRVNLGYIASYLNINQTTLSRIRAERF